MIYCVTGHGGYHLRFCISNKVCRQFYVHSFKKLSLE